MSTPKHITLKRRQPQDQAGRDDGLDRRRGARSTSGCTSTRTTTSSPAVGTEIDDGTRIVVTRIDAKRRTVKVSVAYRTIVRDDDSMYEDKVKRRPRRPHGADRVTYRIVSANGEVVRQPRRRARAPRGRASLRSRSTARRRPSPSRTARLRWQQRLGRARRSASPAATGRSTPATATTAACSSAPVTWLAYGGGAYAPPPTWPVARSRSRSPRRSVPMWAGAPGRPAPHPRTALVPPVT